MALPASLSKESRANWHGAIGGFREPIPLTAVSQVSEAHPAPCLHTSAWLSTRMSLLHPITINQDGREFAGSFLRHTLQLLILASLMLVGVLRATVSRYALTVTSRSLTGSGR